MANYLAKTNTPRPDWVAGDAVNIDSPDLTNNFLTAAGLSAAVKEPKLTDQTNEGVLPHLRHVKTGTYARNGYTNGAAYNPQMNTTSNQLHLSRHYQSGIRNTWGQPKQSCAANTNWAGANETSMPASAEFWGAPSSRAFKLAMGTQSRATPLNGATRSPHMQSNDFTHTTHPHIRESFVPAAVNPTMRTLEVLEPKVNGIKGNFDSTGKLNHDKSGRKKKEYAPGPIEQHSPDLTSHRVPRPDKNYEGSSPSLPSSVSTINISDTGLAPSARRNQSVSDIRSTIGLKPNIHQSGNTWLQYNWAHPQGKDDDEVLQTDSYLDAFIFAWRSAIPGGLLVKFNQENANQDNVADHWRCDINTDKGALLTPLAYPDTMVDTARLNQKLEWRRLNWTSSLLMRRRMGNQHGRKPPSHPKRMDWYCAPGGGQIETTEYVNPREIVEMIEPKIEMPEFNDFVPRIPSFLRPAEKYDMEAVRLIYNWEVQHGHQAMDSQPLEAEDLENILKTTQELGMPFIVAVRGSARELGLMNGNLSYSPYRQFPKDKLDPRGEKRGSGTGSSRSTAKLNVFVHPDYRKNKIGFSLLDMLVTTVSDRYSSQSGYDFIDPDWNPIYKSLGAHRPPSKNPVKPKRQYFRIYAHYLVKHKHVAEEDPKVKEEQKKYDDDLIWVRKIMDCLGFDEKVRFQAVHRSAECGDQPGVWLDEVLFEHTCHFNARLAEKA